MPYGKRTRRCCVGDGRERMKEKNLQLRYEVLLTGMIPFLVDEDGGVVTGR